MQTVKNTSDTNASPVDADDAAPSSALLLTAEEAAKVLRLSRTRIYELMDSHDLPRIKIGGRTRIARRSIEEYVDRLLEQVAS